MSWLKKVYDEGRGAYKDAAKFIVNPLSSLKTMGSAVKSIAGGGGGSGGGVDYGSQYADAFHGLQFPPPRDVGKELRDTMDAMLEYAPRMLEAEREYAPQYLGLEQDMLRQALLGPNSVTETYGQARDKELGLGIDRSWMYGQALSDAQRGMPVSQIQEELERQAQAELSAGMGMTDDERRSVVQGSRRAFADRGLERSMPAVADELVREFNLGRTLQDQRRAFAMQVDQIGEGQRGRAQAILMGENPAAAAGAMGAIAGSGPRYFDPAQNQVAAGAHADNYTGAWSGYNAQSNMLANLFGGQMQMDAARLQADAARRAGNQGMWGSIAGGAMGFLGDVL